MKKNVSGGTWGVRLLIKLFTLVLGILVFWLLGFLMEDIGTVSGPNYQEIEKQYLDQTLVARETQVEKQIRDIDLQISGKREQQQLLSDSSKKLQQTMNQLLELKRLGVEKGVSTLSTAEETSLSASLTHFLENQKAYQNLNQNVTELSSQKQALEDEKRHVSDQLADQQKPAQREYERQWDAHRLRLAFYQLAILVPLLVVSGILLIRGRGNRYFPLLLAFGVATLVKVALVIHKYFPSRYFKYILILTLLAVVARLLVHFIRITVAPKLDWLIRRYREAYERFLCPVCEYPIRTGPRKFLYWTRRTVHKVLPHGDGSAKEEDYTCPACGTKLFEECGHCHGIRHALLEHCEHCGAQKELGSESACGSQEAKG